VPQDIGPFRFATRLEPLAGESIGALRINALADGSVWIVTDRSMMVWNLQGDQRLRDQVIDQDVWWQVAVDDNGQTWVLLQDTGEIGLAEGWNVNLFRADSGWTRVEPFEENWWAPFHLEIIPGSGYMLWVPMPQDVRAFDGFKWDVYTPEDMGFPPVEMADVSTAHILVMAEGGTEAWVGECHYSGPGPMGGGGVRWFDGQTWQGVDAPVGSNCVSALAVGPEGEVWLGTSDAVWQFEHGNNSWTEFQYPQELLSGYSFTHPRQIVVDAAGDVWMLVQMCGGASCDGAANLYRLLDGEWSLVSSAEYWLSSVKQLVLDGNGEAWLFWEGMIYSLGDIPFEPAAFMDALAADVDPDGDLWVVAGPEENPSLWVYAP